LEILNEVGKWERKFRVTGYNFEKKGMGGRITAGLKDCGFFFEVCLYLIFFLVSKIVWIM